MDDEDVHLCTKDAVFPPILMVTPHLPSQLTTAVAAFMTKLRSSMTDETFLQQLSQLGILMEFESLLSCHSDELGMIEDMVVGVQDLSHVVFRIEQGSGTDDIMPTIKGNR